MSIDTSSQAAVEEKIITNHLPQGFVYLKQICPEIKIDLKYASSDNFTGNSVPGYSANSAILTAEAATALCQVQRELEQQNLGLLIWDAYRPTKAVDSFLKWEHEADDLQIKQRFYTKMSKREIFEFGLIAPGHSSHSRGSTVDLTIYSLLSGQELDMGTDFDYFAEESYTSSKEISSTAESNRKILVGLMAKYGFDNFPKEWWHYTLRDEPFPNQYFNFEVK